MQIGMDLFIIDATRDSGLPEEVIEEMTSMMVQYINEGAKYGDQPEDFLKWYVTDMGKTL